MGNSCDPVPSQRNPFCKSLQINWHRAGEKATLISSTIKFCNDNGGLHNLL